MLNATTALAQVAPVAERDTAAEDSGALNDILVVAQKRQEKLGDVPISVDVVQGESLQRLNLSNFEQMSRYVPTFNVSETASGNRITLRGISSGTNRGFEQSVGLFVDGIYAGRAAQFSSPFFDVERIEVLKGPQSILFGKNTVAGAVSIITARPTKEASLLMSAGYETRFGGYNVSAVANEPLTDNLQMRIAVRREQRLHGVLYNSLMKAHEPSRENDVARVSLAWQPGAVEVNAKYEYSDQVRNGSLFQVIASGGRDALFKSVDPQFETNLDLRNSIGKPNSDLNSIAAHNAALRIDVPIGRGHLTSDTGYSTYKVKSEREDADFTPVQLIEFSNREKFTQFSQELRYASPADDTIAYTIGAFYQNQHYLNAPVYFITASAVGLFDVNSARHFNQRADTYSAFGELSVQLAPGLRVIGGGRYVAENKRVARDLSVINPLTGLPATDPTVLALTQRLFGTRNFALDQKLNERQFTPAVTLQYKPYEGLMTYAKFSRGFKSGGFDASDGMGTANPYLSENVSAYEAGVKWDASRRLNMNLTGFYSRFNNLQSQVYNGIAFITTNAARASARGVEFETRWRPIKPLTLSGSAAYLDAHYDDYRGAACTTGQAAAFAASGAAGSCTQDLSGRPLTDASRWTASLNANFEQGLANDWRMQLNAGTNIRSSAYVAPDLDPIGLQKGYATIDGSIELISPSDTFTISLVGKNLGDVRAKTYVVNSPFFSGTKSASINEPRTVEIRGTLRF
ncbi:TonB-dependent receptor [uncultured Sphingomonas sp.]|uniref:TonB-dependent receptor n=1 Tax=uncultured Sphingomonas sp. TaxID=158754 RepID=UPI00263442BE|nr:TonB-dependent receptor [uncultured Sphingomonas sp.]